METITVQRTSWVRLSKVLLAAIVFMLLAGLGLLLFFSDDKNVPLVTPDQQIILDAAASKAEQPNMIEPRFEGYDRSNHRYVITADKATQPDLDTVDMQLVRANIELDGEDLLTITADNARWGVLTEEVQLQGNVTVRHSDGYVFVTEEAQFNMKEMTGAGEQPIMGEGPQGEIQAERFTLTDNGERLILENNVRVTVQSKT